MKLSHRRRFIDRESYVAQYLALAIFITGVASAIGSDGLLAAFAAGHRFHTLRENKNNSDSYPTGSAISWDGDFNTHTEGEVFASVIDLVLNCACFVYIGAWISFEEFSVFNLWRLAILTVGVMVLKRIPVILALYKWIPEITSWREALISGHFSEIFLPLLSQNCLAN